MQQQQQQRFEMKMQRRKRKKRVPNVKKKKKSKKMQKIFIREMVRRWTRSYGGKIRYVCHAHHIVYIWIMRIRLWMYHRILFCSTFESRIYLWSAGAKMKRREKTSNNKPKPWCIRDENFLLLLLLVVKVGVVFHFCMFNRIRSSCYFRCCCCFFFFLNIFFGRTGGASFSMCTTRKICAIGLFSVLLPFQPASQPTNHGNVFIWKIKST